MKKKKKHDQYEALTALEEKLEPDLMCMRMDGCYEKINDFEDSHGNIMGFLSIVLFVTCFVTELLILGTSPGVFYFVLTILNVFFTMIFMVSVDSIHSKMNYFLYQFIPFMRNKLTRRELAFSHWEKTLEKEENGFAVMTLLEETFQLAKVEGSRKSLEEFSELFNKNLFKEAAKSLFSCWGYYKRSKELLNTTIGQKLKKDNYQQYKDSFKKQNEMQKEEQTDNTQLNTALKEKCVNETSFLQQAKNNL